MTIAESVRKVIAGASVRSVVEGSENDFSFVTKLDGKQRSIHVSNVSGLEAVKQATKNTDPKNVEMSAVQAEVKWSADLDIQEWGINGVEIFIESVTVELSFKTYDDAGEDLDSGRVTLEFKSGDSGVEIEAIRESDSFTGGAVAPGQIDLRVVGSDKTEIDITF